MEDLNVKVTNNVGVQTVNKCKCCCHNQDVSSQTASANAHTQTFETDFCDSGNVDCAEDWKPPEGSSIADLVREVVEKAAPQSDYTYDENTNLYYSAKMGYYYDPERCLFYEPYSGTYYSYDEKSQSYQFYCQVKPTICKDEDITNQKSTYKKKHRRKPFTEEKECTKTLRKRRHKAAKNGKQSKQFTKSSEEKHSTSENCLIHSERKSPVMVLSADSNSDIEDLEESSYWQTDISSSPCTIITNDPEAKLKERTHPMEQSNKSDVEVTLSELVKKVADEACDQPDYVYDDHSHLYYSTKTGYYYDPEKHLFYEPNSGTCYSYDEKSEAYHLYCHTEPSNYESNKKKKKEKRKKRKRGENSVKNGKDCKNTEKDEKPAKDDKQSKPSSSEDQQHIGNESCEMPSDENFSDILLSDTSSSTLEEGEVSNSSDSNIQDNPVEAITDDQDSAQHWPPCIRAVVQESMKLTVGSLLLITYNGGTIGREKSNSFCVPDSSVSKRHGEIKYDDETEKYFISDLGSQNGTWVNEERLSKTREASQPFALNHGDHLTLGKCKFLLHIHSGNDTCDDCEPGQVQAKLNTQKEETSKPFIFKTKEEKEMERRFQLRNIKKKFGLKNMAYETDWKNMKESGYEDRAQNRRTTVGSDNPYEKDEIPSSLSQSVSTQNKGYKLLQKMGWSEGQSLGKSQIGIHEPIPLEIRAGRAGLGAHQVPKLPVDRRKQRWCKVQERYKRLPPSTEQK